MSALVETCAVCRGVRRLPACDWCGGSHVSLRLVPRDAPPLNDDVPLGAEPLQGAAPASPVSAGEALCSLPQRTAIGGGTPGPSPQGGGGAADAGEEVVTVTLGPAVALIWRLVRAHDAALADDESFARAVCWYAEALGVPALARDGTVDFADLPCDRRVGQNRFARSRAPP